MKRNRIITSAIIIGVIIISATIIGILRPWIKKDNAIEIIFEPNNMLSCPGHTAWLLANIVLNQQESLSEFTINIVTNVSIEKESKLWLNSEDSGLIEIFLYPNSTHLEKTVEVTVNATNNEISASSSAFVTVVNWTMTIDAEIYDMQNRFVQYLEANCTSYNINNSISWQEFGSAPMILIVSHYLFKSEFWEMELSRHVTMEPHDWVKIYLRPRNSLLPIWCGKINSWLSSNHTIEVIVPPDEIYR
jgi:hypothetical protein